MSAHIFAVVSPLQYMNALEAIHQFQLKPEQCYLAVGTSKKLPATTLQLEKILDRSLFRRIEYVYGFPAVQGFTEVDSLAKAVVGAREYAKRADTLINAALVDWPSVQRVFIGDFRPSNFRHFIGRLKDAEVWLLDDGSVTHQVVRFRKDPQSPHLFAKQFGRNSRKHKLICKLSGLKFGEPRVVRFFTCYDIDLPLQDRVKYHDYAHFKQRYPKLGSSEDVWFIGSNHVENGFTDLERYLQLMRSVRHYYGRRRVLYLPHRGEEPTKLDAVRALGFETTSFDLPIEIVVGERGVLPARMGAIASSAVDNLSVMVGDKTAFDIFRLGSDYCSGARWKHLKDVIDYHERNVLGLCHFVHERDSAAIDDASDLRLQNLPQPGAGGYAMAQDRYLRGVDYSSDETTLAPGPCSLKIDDTGPNRQWFNGDRIRIIAVPSGVEVLAEVSKWEPSGLLQLSIPDGQPSVSAGAWQLVRDQARLQVNAISGQTDGVVFEPGSKNLVQQSVAFDASRAQLENSAWSSVGLAAFGQGSSGSVAILRSPAGRFDASFLRLDLSKGEHGIEQQVSIPEGGLHSLSVYVRGGGVDSVQLSIRDAAGVQQRATFDLTSDAEVCDRTRVATRLPRAWWRIELPCELVAGQASVRISLLADKREVFDADGCSGLYLWGAQLERGACATSLIPRIVTDMSRAHAVYEAQYGAQGSGSLEFMLSHPRAEVSLVNLGEECRILLRPTEQVLVVESAGQEQHYAAQIQAAQLHQLHWTVASEQLTLRLNGGDSHQLGASVSTSGFSVAGGPMLVRRVTAS